MQGSDFLSEPFLVSIIFCMAIKLTPAGGKEDTCVWHRETL